MHYLHFLVTNQDIGEVLEPFYEGEHLTAFDDNTEYVVKRWNELDEEKKQKYKDLDDYAINNHCCVIKKDNDENRYGYYYNPNALYDWYEIGGRWDGIMRNSKGDKVNVTQLYDYGGILKEFIDCLDEDNKIIIDGDMYNASTVITNDIAETRKNIHDRMNIDKYGTDERYIYVIDMHI